MPSTNNDLSEREQEILRLVATGASNKEIAQKLFISANTVKVHLRNIFAKIGAASRTEAAMYAVNAGLIARSAADLQARSGLPEDILVEEAPSANQEVLAVEPARVSLSARWYAVVILILLGIIGFTAYLVFANENQTSGPPLVNAPSRWQSLAPMSVARLGLAVAVYENQLFAIAGLSEQGPTGAVERYDPAADAWTDAAEKPLAVWDVGAAVIGGKIYIPGGRISPDELTDALEIYDPRLDAWTQGAPAPFRICAYALATFEGKIYLFGGWDGKNYLDTVLVYDPGENQWSYGSPLPTARAYAGAAVTGRAIFVLGGYSGKKAMTTNEVFYPDLAAAEGSSWEKKTAMPEGTYAMGVASIADLIHVIGGVTFQQAATARVSLQYQPLADTWQYIESPAAESFSNFGMAPLGTLLYVIGGQSGDKPTNQNLAYQAIYTVALPVIR